MTGKRILIVSDDSRLARAIELNLQHRWPVTALVLEDPVSAHSPYSYWALIIVSLSSQVGEPLVALQRAGLTPCIEQVPILIISERRFEAGPRDLIQHLDYPFLPDTLQAAVEHLMQVAAGLGHTPQCSGARGEAARASR